MDEKQNQVADNPVSTTDQAPRDRATEAPTAEAEGVGAAAAEDTTTTTSHASSAASTSDEQDNRQQDKGQNDQEDHTLAESAVDAATAIGTAALGAASRIFGLGGSKRESANSENPAQTQSAADTVDASADTSSADTSEDRVSERSALLEDSTDDTPSRDASEGDDTGDAARVGAAATSEVQETSTETSAEGENRDLSGEDVGSASTEMQEAPEASNEASGAEVTEATEAPQEASQETGDDEARVQTLASSTESPEASSDTASSGSFTASSTDAAEMSTGTSTEAPAEAPTETMTMEDVMAASDDQLARKPIHRGMITTGTVIMLSQEGVVTDVNAKIEGIIPYNQLFEFDANAEEAAKYFKPGDEIQVYVIRADIPNNTITLSKKRADQERAWTLLQDIFEKELPVEVEVVEKVRGGLVANLGVRAFLPASQIDVRRVNDLTPYVDTRIRVKIIELNRKRNRVIISRRAIIEQELAGLKEETLKRLEPGAKLEGEVVEITDFGAFVNLGGIDGLVHRSEITHGRFNHPREVVKVGQKVRVEVLDMDLERERINLSMKKLVSNPWENVLANYSIGQKIEGKVTNLTPFGAFVEIEPGLEGLIHVSEMSWTKRVRHPKEVLSEGEDVEAMILKIDTSQERISLGLRQTQPDPWSSLPDRFPPGTEITGPITGITDFGVFMEIEEGIEGLVHISELAHEHIDDITQHFNKGDEITAVILNIDPIEQRASLSRKRLMPYTAGEFEAAGAPMGAPASRGGGRKGRRGGRRSQGIDYDYSYAASDTGTKATTKLGDVYADLFAQFGLTDKGGDSSGGETNNTDADTDTASAQASTQVSEASADPATTPQRAPQTEHATAEVAEQVEPSEEELKAQVPADQAGNEETPEPQAQTADEDEVDPENAIDAAEAAALLTAAFREGRKPAPRQEERQEERQEKQQEEQEEQDRVETSEA